VVAGLHATKLKCWFEPVRGVIQVSVDATGCLSAGCDPEIYDHESTGCDDEDTVSGVFTTFSNPAGRKFRCIPAVLFSSE